MDDPNITMEEYIKLEEEKAQRCGKVFNWETTKYGKIWIDEDVHNLRSVETKFPAITLINEISSEKHFIVNPRCFDDLDFFNDFENEFPAIVYNDALTSKSDLSTEPTLCPQHINDFDLKDETSLSEYGEKNKTFYIALPLRDQYLRYERLQYTDVDITYFKERLRRIYTVERYTRMLMEYHDDGGEVVFTREEIESPSFARFLETSPSYTLIRDLVLRLCHRMMSHSIASRSQAPEKVTMIDLFYLRGMDVGSVNIPYLLDRYLRRFATGRKSGALISGGQFVAQLAKHFGLLTEERL
ncbi:hypothetical protein Tco_0322203 [Tanacetum coccineum]